MVWDSGKPIAGRKARYIDDDIRDNNAALEAAFDAEHDFTTGGTQTGRHAQGSARAFFQATAPTTRVDGEDFDDYDLGSIWIDSDDNQIYILTATTPTWTVISTELFATFLAAARVFGDTLDVTGDFSVNTDKFTVDADTGDVGTDGDVIIAGGIDVTGVATIGDASALTTDAAPTEDEEIANKKYVDDTVGDTVDALTISPTYDATVLVNNAAAPESFTDMDIATLAEITAQRMLVYVKLLATSTETYEFRTNGDAQSIANGSGDPGGCTKAQVKAGNIAYFYVMTDTNGKIEWMGTSTANVTVTLLTWEKVN